jgi:chemotaxis protein methyltransferase CheR
MNAVSALAALIEKTSGIVVPQRDLTRLQRTALERARANRLADLDRYLRLLEQDHDGAEWRQLLSLITIKESYLYRAPQHWRALAEEVIPGLLPGRRQVRTLSVWSAGCARGEEASTIATVLADRPELRGWDWRVLATDVDEKALTEARRGRYGGRAVSRVPRGVLERHFVARGDRFELSPELRRRIDYRPLNLLREPLDVPGAPFDVIYLRNVLIYFRAESQRRVVGAIGQALAPDGYLFLGPTESLMHLSRKLAPVDLGDCFCYRWPQSPSDIPWADPRTGSPPEKSHRPPEQVSQQQPVKGRAEASGSSGAHSQRQASAPARPSHAATNHGTRPAGSLQTLIDSIVEELASNRLERAKSLITEGARRFPEEATMRAFEGLALDIDRDDRQAVRAYRAALYLDPRLVQVRFLLARCMERLDLPDRSQRDYRELLAVLRDRKHRMLPGSERLGLPSLRQLEAASRQALGGHRNGR